MKFRQLLPLLTVFCVTNLAASSSPAHAQTDAYFYYVIPSADLNLEYRKPTYYTVRNLVPYAIIDGAPDTWVCRSLGKEFKKWDFELAIRSSEPLKKIQGKIYLPHWSKPELTEFAIDLAPSSLVQQKKFYSAQEKYYRHLAEGNFVGQAWFHHKLNQALARQDKKPATEINNNRWRNNSLDVTFETFSGTRAITENIQLDRNMRIGKQSARTIDVNSIRGITIKEFDWQPHLAEKRPQLDELADAVPYDQHVILLQSVGAFQQALGQVSNLLMPAFDSVATEAVDQEVIPKYLQQLQINLQELGKNELAAKIKNVAITGSDPYSEIGTDIGILLQLQDVESAEQFRETFLKQIQSTGPLEGLPNSGFRVNADRSVSVYCFQQQDKLVISNSLYQLNYLKKCLDGQVKSVASLTEFRFFRQRYVLTPDETAFVFMSDAAIRRWCSPRWRIAQSRRMRAMAELQRLQAQHMPSCLKLQDQQRIKLKPAAGVGKPLGEVTLSKQGVHSSQFGSLAFVTPISEMEVSQVSEQEKAAYQRWREGYERNWTQAFDPIGIQLKIEKKVVKADISVIPLILNSSYRWIADGTAMSSLAGDSHSDALIHFIAAPGTDRFLTAFFKGLRFVEVYVDEDTSFWRDFDTEKEAEKYFRKNLQKFPLAVGLEFDKAESMERVLEFAKSMVTSMITSESTVKYKNREYLKLQFEDEYLFQEYDKIHLHVFKSENRALFSLSENLIKRAIDRQTGKQKTGRQWLGKNMSVQINQRLFRTMEGFSADFYRASLRNRTWNNLPILNEWKREFPESDPLELHRDYWGQRLLCPGGGTLKWDSQAQTYYSTAFGSPSRPRIPMGTPYPWRSIERFDAGVSFETGGLRAKVELHKK